MGSDSSGFGIVLEAMFGEEVNFPNDKRAEDVLIEIEIRLKAYSEISELIAEYIVIVHIHISY